MRQRLFRDLFSGVVDTLVEGASHLQGLEWEAVNVVSATPLMEVMTRCKLTA